MNSRRDTQDKDELLGAALRRLDVPEHGPDFFSELRERVEAEDSAERSGSRRSTASRHPWWRRPVARLVAVPLVAAAMLVIWAWSGRPVPDVIEMKPATAAEVQAKLDTALRTIRSLRGVLVVSHLEETTGAMDEMRWTFASTARGDFQLSGVSRQEDLAYDAATGVERVLARDGDWVVASERIGLAAGRPDPWPSDFMLERELGSVVRALRNAEDPGVRETTLDGRPVWVLDAAVQPNRLSTGSGDHLEVTVDQETGFAVRIVESRGGQVVYEIRLEDLEIDPALPADTFTLRFPEGVEVGHLDQGFRRVDLDQVEGAVGYAPLVPAWVPEGYELTEVAVAAKGGPTGTEGMNPDSRGVVSLGYRRGFDRFVISTRLTGDDDRYTWTDPLASGEGYVDDPETIAVQSGAFAGLSAELLIDPRTVPHVWARGERLVVTVSGDLDREELIGVLQSLGRPGAD